MKRFVITTGILAVTLPLVVAVYAAAGTGPAGSGSRITGPGWPWGSSCSSSRRGAPFNRASASDSLSNGACAWRAPSTCWQRHTGAARCTQPSCPSAAGAPCSMERKRRTASPKHSRTAGRSPIPSAAVPVPPIGVGTGNHRPHVSAAPGPGAPQATQPGCGWNAPPTPAPVPQVRGARRQWPSRRPVLPPPRAP